MRIIVSLPCTAACFASLLYPVCSGAQAVQPREALEDTKLYFTAPLRWDGRDWLEFGGTLVALGIIHEFDDDVRDQFFDPASDTLDGEDPNNFEDALPAAVMLAGTWLLAGIVERARRVAFAIGTVLAESGDDRYRLARRILGYGLAGTTAYLRLDHNQHWASDVAAGAALGLSTARFVMNRREGSTVNKDNKMSFSVMPGARGGVMFAFAMPLH